MLDTGLYPYDSGHHGLAHVELSQYARQGAHIVLVDSSFRSLHLDVSTFAHFIVRIHSHTSLVRLSYVLHPVAGLA